MNRTRFFLVLVVCALLQVSLADAVRILGVKPDLLLICVVIASLNFERGYAILAALVCGILKDTFSVTGFGLHTFLLPLLSMLVVFIARKIALDSVALAGLASFLLTLVYDAASRTVYAVLGEGISIPAYLRVSFLQALYTAAVFPLVLRLVRRTV